MQQCVILHTFTVGSQLCTSHPSRRKGNLPVIDLVSASINSPSVSLRELRTSVIKMAHNAHGSSMAFVLFTKTVKVLKRSLTKIPPHPRYLILPQRTMINTWLPSKQGHFRCDLCSANYAPRSPFHQPKRDLEVSTISQTLEEMGWKMKLRDRVCMIVEAHPNALLGQHLPVDVGGVWEGRVEKESTCQ